MNKSADLGTLPAIWKGKIDSLKDEARNLNVTYDDVQPFKRQSKKAWDDLLSDYFNEKKKLAI